MSMRCVKSRHHAASPDQRSPELRRAELSAKLKRLREQAGVSTRELAARTDISQTKISKLENNQVNLRPEDVRHILDCLHVRPEIRKQLTEAAIQLQQALSTKAFTPRPEVSLIDAEQTHEVFQTARECHAVTRDLIPIVFQTDEYTALMHRTCGSLMTLDTWMRIKNELKQPQGVLKYRRDIANERTFRRPILDRATWLEQLRIVKQRMYQPGVELGIIPEDVQAPLSTWLTFDDTFTLSENAVDTAGLFYSNPDTVKRYVDEMEFLTDRAVWGGEAIRMINDAIRYVETIDLRHRPPVSTGQDA
jgi:transcriptional regulator with XRE-family HTH domain